MVSISNSPANLPIQPSNLPANTATSPQGTVAGTSAQPNDVFESLVTRPFQEWLGQQGLTLAPGQEPRVFVLTAEQSASMNRAIHSGNTQASSEAFGAIASGIDGLGAQEPTKRQSVVIL